VLCWVGREDVVGEGKRNDIMKYNRRYAGIRGLMII
jgi:hypothetical protein